MPDEPQTPPPATPTPEQPQQPIQQQQPVQTGTPQKPTDDKDKRRPRTGILLSFMGLFLFLFVLFLVFLVVMLLQNGGNNPILGALGVEPALLQQLLQTLVSLVFGLLSMVSFLVMVIGLFRRFTSAKAEVQKKKSSLILAAVSGAFFIFCVFLWITLYFYISRLQIASQGAAVILSEPEQTIGLTAPIDVTFTAREIEQLYNREGIVSYSWDLDADGSFDDGNGRDIQYRYTDKGNADGIYDVTVRVVLGTGQEVEAVKRLSIANVLPTIRVDYRPDILEVPVEMTFDASSTTDPDGRVISYDWDFNGDGATDAQGAEAVWEFTEPQEERVTISVLDNSGQTATEEIILDFREGRVREAVINARPGLEGEIPYSVTLDGSASYIAERIQVYEWDFGDNTPVQNGRSVQHVYQNEGSYTVVLTIEGESGERYEQTAEIVARRPENRPQPVLQVLNATPVNGLVRGEAPLQLSFDASDSTDRDGSVVEVQWDFDGDGVTDALGETAQHTFIEAGTTTVILTVIDDDDLESQQELRVEVSVPELLVDIQVSQFSGPVPLEITFDASASRAEQGSIISYTWDFGDGSPEVIGSAKQTHVYTNVGEYTVNVEVVTNDGKRAEKELLIVAREVELQADFSVNPAESRSGQKVFFDASLSQGQISSYYWEFGDGLISRVVKPDHIYEVPGTYTVKLEVYDRKNRVSRKEVKVTVNP